MKPSEAIFRGLQSPKFRYQAYGTENDGKGGYCALGVFRLGGGNFDDLNGLAPAHLGEDGGLNWQSLIVHRNDNQRALISDIARFLHEHGL